jgi:hypothetical protein
MTTDKPTELAAPLPALASPRRRWLTTVLALVIFLAGAVSGAALTVVVAMNRIQFAIQHPEAAPPRIASTIARRLDLDESQRGQVEAIIARRQKEISAIRRKFQPEIAAELEGVREEVAAVLNNAQRERWEQLFDQFQARWLPALPEKEPKTD